MGVPLVLFVHNNFPGQFGFLANALASKGWRCIAIASEKARGLPNVEMLRWKLSRGTARDIFPFAVRAEADLMRGHAAARCAQSLKACGIEPDLIIGHPGWGETIFLKQIFPKARLILHGEFFYHASGFDAGFDPEFPTADFNAQCRIHAKNATMSLAYSEADHIVCPTPFQASALPAVFQPRVSIIHEGIDLERIRSVPNPAIAFLDLPIPRDAPIVTFVNRILEPLRGFHVFMRALPRLLSAVPNAQAVLVGGEGPGGYGGEPSGGGSWKNRYLDEVKSDVDMSRMHFLGRVPHDRMLSLISLSSAHVYYTYPFVLSWSLLEAMACECYVVASDTAPVRDAIVDGVNGRLLPFFDVSALADTLVNACRHPNANETLRKVARQTIQENFDQRSICLPAWLKLIDRS